MIPPILVFGILMFIKQKIFMSIMSVKLSTSTVSKFVRSFRLPYYEKQKKIKVVAGGF